MQYDVINVKKHPQQCDGEASIITAVITNTADGSNKCLKDTSVI